MNSIPALVAVFLGGGIGASLRYGSTKGLLALGMMESRLHWATFIINIMASVALVYVYKLTPEKSTIQLFLATGICGGWSTFSTFSYETVRLIQQGREWEALAYVLSSVAVAFAASASFISPFGYQTNLLVFNAANYKFAHFIKIGLPISVMYSTIVLTLLNITYL